jgi:hypothetical protein
MRMSGGGVTGYNPMSYVPGGSGSVNLEVYNALQQPSFDHVMKHRDLPPHVQDMALDIVGSKVKEERFSPLTPIDQFTASNIPDAVIAFAAPELLPEYELAKEGYKILRSGNFDIMDMLERIAGNYAKSSRRSARDYEPEPEPPRLTSGGSYGSRGPLALGPAQY